MKPWMPACLLAFMLHAGSLSADTEESPSDGKEDKILVSISGRKVEFTCPEGKEKFMKEDKTLTSGRYYELENFADENNGMYSCGEKSTTKSPTYLYLKAYVCDNCIDVSIPVVAGILIGDCMVTLGVAFIIYFGCRKQTGPLREGGMSNGARAKGKQEKPPPVPNPDYEVLRKGQRDVYDGLGTRTRLK